MAVRVNCQRKINPPLNNKSDLSNNWFTMGSREVLKLFNQELKDWEEAADKFARHCLVCFCEHEPCSSSNGPNADEFTWDAFCAWVKKLEQSGRLIDRLRLDVLYKNIRGIRTNSTHRNILTSCRNRSRTRWTEKQKNQMEKVFGESRQKQKQEQDDDIDNLVDEATVKTFSTLAMSNLIKETSCNNPQPCPAQPGPPLGRVGCSPACCRICLICFWLLVPREDAVGRFFNGTANG